MYKVKYAVNLPPPVPPLCPPQHVIDVIYGGVEPKELIGELHGD